MNVAGSRALSVFSIILLAMAMMYCVSRLPQRSPHFLRALVEGKLYKDVRR
jgi:hypothetical protein